MMMLRKTSLATVAALLMIVGNPSASSTALGATAPLPPLQMRIGSGWAVRDTGVAELRVKYRCGAGQVAEISPHLRQPGDELSSFGTTNQTALTCDGAPHAQLYTFLGFYDYEAFYAGPATY